MSSDVTSSDPAGTAAREYRPTRWSIPWLAIPILAAYEIVVLAWAREGGPLSHVLWWATGSIGSPRWVIVGGALAGFCVWLAGHILWRTPGLADLAVACVVGIAVLTFYALMR